MKLDDAEQAKYEALAEAIWLCLKPLTELAEVAATCGYAPPMTTQEFEQALDSTTLALMKLVDDAYKQGRHDNNEEWLEVERSHLEQ